MASVTLDHIQINLSEFTDGRIISMVEKKATMLLTYKVVLVCLVKSENQ